MSIIPTYVFISGLNTEQRFNENADMSTDEDSWEDEQTVVQDLLWNNLQEGRNHLYLCMRSTGSRTAF